jgi:voltage-gated potassium channel
MWRRRERDGGDEQGRAMVRRLHARLEGRTSPLTREQLAARDRWQRRWNLPILLAATIPLFATTPDSRATQLVVGIGSWLIFVIDLLVQRRIVPDYLHRASGRIDLAIVVLTFPYYLIPGLGGLTGILLIARLARVARVVMATAGLRRVAARLGKVMVVASLTVLVASLVAYGAEHPDNPGFATFGDALWWGIVTLTTVGYGDIVPKTFTGRLAGVAIMFTGVATIGILAGSLASVFGLGGEAPERETDASTPGLHEELAALQGQLKAVETSLGEVAERARSAAGSTA